MFSTSISFDSISDVRRHLVYLNDTSFNIWGIQVQCNFRHCRVIMIG
jgi:hypothetical protein